MIKFSDVSVLTKEIDDAEFGYDLVDGKYQLPKGIAVFEITGPLFFGAAYKFKDAMRYIEKHPPVLIIRMRHVPIIDVTGIQVLKEVHKESLKHGTKIILSELHSEQVKKELQNSRLLFAIGKGNVTDTFERALEKAEQIMNDR